MPVSLLNGSAKQREFEIDKQIDHKLLISVVPDDYLRRVA
ncbi:MAG: CmcI family methyltransferase [Lamprobacter sp.]|nr:CmcI family methyltransferase [Lamprobacter sp.]MEA3642794.1 CmcI family methyltransferase [Lamprobacter sp.]